MKVAQIYIKNVLTVRMYSLYTRKNLDLLEQGRMGNDDVSSLNARKCVAGNDDIKAGNARRRYGYCDVTMTGDYVHVNLICFLKLFL